MPYQPIESYGVIGNMHSSALVGINGSIDWYCFPQFDSPSVFGAILDDKKGGKFSIRPQDATCRNKQFYLPDTNVLVTRFLSAGGLGEITDFMPVQIRTTDPHNHWLIRSVDVIRGSMSFHLSCQPRFNYAREGHTTEINQNGAQFCSSALSMELATMIPLTVHNSGVTADFELSEGQSAVFVFRQNLHPDGCGPALTSNDRTQLLNSTVGYWRKWLSQCNYRGRWREMVQRSALVLKLLTFEPTGAMVAAPTTSLPEAIGGARNWDYRYTWIRDAAFTLYALMRVGFKEESLKFMKWLNDRCHDIEPDGTLQVLYGIDGRRNLEEQVLAHLDGYMGSRPVRIGNAAAHQQQLDIYGELMDSVYLHNKYAEPISYDLWKQLSQIANYVCDNWNQPDCGVWEIRGPLRHFVYSKVLCWVAIDRALRLADKRSFPAEVDRWTQVRNQIYEEIMERGWNQKLHSFSQSYEDMGLDAANLIMPLVFFLSPSDPRMLQTIDAINKPISQGGLVDGCLVHRYNARMTEDGVGAAEGTFNMCSFWLVEALTRAGRSDRRKLEEARLLFERLLTHANHLGLYGEQTGLMGETLGNFPQAFTHLALISAAYNLNLALDEP